MNNIKTIFSINDLENLSGIKAHTIRIWEKRYYILEPMRTTSNIRMYDIDNLQKVLNIAILYENGVKISHIAKMSLEELRMKVADLMLNQNVRGVFTNSLKLAMLNFDQYLFEKTYSQLLSQKSFREIFMNVFVPFLDGVGLLWQTSTITPAHEHFISHLIKQKLLVNIERMQLMSREAIDETYVLFLPLNEIHELGLLFIHFELLLRGKNSIYLGQSVPIENLTDLQDIYKKINFISYFTVAPQAGNVVQYLDEFNKLLLWKRDDQLVVLGRKISTDIDLSKLSNIKAFRDLREFIQQL